VIDRLESTGRALPETPADPATAETPATEPETGAAPTLADELFGEEEDAEEAEAEEAQPQYPTLRLFDPEEAERLSQRSKDQGDREVKMKLTAIFKNLGEPDRRLATFPEDWDVRLADLRERMPNFSVVLDLVEQTVALSRLGDGTLQLPPMLLLGDPGIGKSFFCRLLGEAADTGYFELGMASATAPWVLTGLDASWTGSKPGLVFDSLVKGPTANPIILLDEVEKAALGDRKYDVLAGLLPLLESHSARVFVDESVGLPIDASRVNWVLTGNSTEGLSAPILSRLTVIEVPSPDAQQSAVIAASVWRELRANSLWGSTFPEHLDHGVIAGLVEMAPRAMKKALNQAAAQAARCGRTEVWADDLPKPPARDQRPRLGFI